MTVSGREWGSLSPWDWAAMINEEVLKVQESVNFITEVTNENDTDIDLGPLKKWPNKSWSVGAAQPKQF